MKAFHGSSNKRSRLQSVVLSLLTVLTWGVLAVWPIRADEPLDWASLEVASRIPGWVQGLEIQGDTAYLLARNELYLLDISDLTQPRLLSYLELPARSFALDIKVVADKAYIASEVLDQDGVYYVDGLLSIVDISDPTNPMLLGSHQQAGPFYRIWLQGDYAFTAGSVAAQEVYNIWDITDPTTPIPVVVNAPGQLLGIAGNGLYGYVAGHEKIVVVDFTDPLNPVDRGEFPMPPTGTYQIYTDAVTDGVLLYLVDYTYADDETRLRILDSSDPDNPVQVGLYTWDNYRVFPLALADDYLFLGALGGTLIMDVSTLSNPVEVNTYTSWAADVRISDSVAIIADYERGLRLVDFQNVAALDLIGQFDTQIGNDITMKGQYSFIGRWGGLNVFDLFNPALPRQIGTLETETDGYALELTVDGDDLYFLGQNSGVHKIDISDPTTITPGINQSLGGLGTDLAVATNYVFATARSNDPFLPTGKLLIYDRNLNSGWEL